ncbi:pyrroloquinoline quinone biosynthesis protein PqqB [Limobrevibacterium gyesilva]|uniref:Coenzyme PQQ synthesis protein B n=1 Tax=Limobrevibacterium gyesilva TaxID=2991712 RepID=A0AA42CD49_9PROT|nr:pyrroloquinoline quinone biosynthesis protein PqqB [Limobrevibacterium gyesilva]MCW3473254.1 pyrroloquinoline quinone biosynthesis protein PqqB [Limobrevibacterium gyesilva]
MPPSGLTALILGAGAGGGVPQWNCACRVCQLVRSGDARVCASTQVGVAFSADETHWLLVGASPDLRQQILKTPQLHPREGPRDSPIFATALISADVDGIAGLLVLREQQRLSVFAPGPVLEVLRRNAVFDVLNPAMVDRIHVAPLHAVDCGYGLTLTLLPMPGKVPLYLEDRAAEQPQAAPTYAALVQANGHRVIVAPACAEISDTVRSHLRLADVVFFDGTLFTDDEMITAGVGTKTGRRMGHVPVSGVGGSLEGLADLPARKIFLHINNTNPLLLNGSPERRQAEEAGFEVAFDGMEVRL